MELEISKEDITFYGNTEEEKRLNEKIFDLSLENDYLEKENKRLKEISEIKECIIQEAIFELQRMSTAMYDEDYDIKDVKYDELMNILNGGDEE